MAARRYRVIASDDGILYHRLAAFAKRESADQRMDEILADRRSRLQDDWLLIIDAQTREHLRVEGRGRNAGKPLPVYKRIR